MEKISIQIKADDVAEMDGEFFHRKGLRIEKDHLGIHLTTNSIDGKTTTYIPLSYKELINLRMATEYLLKSLSEEEKC